MLVIDYYQLKPETAINKRSFKKYTVQIEVFRNELVRLHSNLSLLNQLIEFDVTFFHGPRALISYLTQILMTDCVLICTRIWKDKPRKSLTLDKFKDWFLKSAIRPEYREIAINQLNLVCPNEKVEGILDSLRGIRHARLAHLDPEMIGGLSDLGAPVSLVEIREVADSLGEIYQAMNLGAHSLLVSIEFIRLNGGLYEGELGDTLARIAVASIWFRDSGDQKGYWDFLMSDVTPEQLEKISEVRKHFGMHPLSDNND